MLCQTQTNGCLPCHTGTAMNLQTCSRRKETGAPPPGQHIQPIPDLTPFLPRTQYAPPGDNKLARRSLTDTLPPGYVCSHTLLPNSQFCYHDAYAQDSQHDTEYNRDMLTDEGTSTG